MESERKERTMKKHLILLGLGLGVSLGIACIAHKAGFFENDKQAYDEFDSTLQDE